MEVSLSKPGVRWVFFGAVLAAAGTLAYSGGKISLASHYAAQETPEGLRRATQLEPSDAQHWYLLGRYWQYNFDQPDLTLAVSYYQRALALDPRSSNTWTDLADAHEELGNMVKAREAFQQAQEAYPISAEVAWRYANFLFRRGEHREAFAQIRRTVAADPSRAAAALTICWRADQNIDAILDEALPASVPVYLDAIRTLSGERAGSATLEIWKRLAALRPKLELKDVFPFLDELVAEGLVPEAHAVWNSAVELAGAGQPEPPADGSLVWDGGFEAPFADGGFGWRWTPHPGVEFAFDSGTKHSGTRSLRIAFEGGENLSFGNLVQYVVVEPGKTYQFSAYFKTDEITTDRGLGFAVFDPRSPGTTGRLTADLTGTQPWTRIALTFTAGANTRVAAIALRRVPSEKLDNKLQGTVWVDDVSLVPLELTPKRSAR